MLAPAIKIVAYTLIALGTLCIGANAWIIFNRLVRKQPRDRFVSLMPFVGGVFGALGMWLSGVPKLVHFAWLPLVLDMSCAPMAVAGIVWWARRGKR